ncbi:MAG: transcription termination factor NusA [Treponema sp.]
MADNISESLKAFALEKGLDDDLVIYVVQQALRAAYKKEFGTDSNVVFKTEEGNVLMFSKKTVVERVKDPAFEISLKEATKFTNMAEIGDELTIEVEPMKFKMMAAHAGKQRALQCLQEIQKDSLYAEYNAKLGEIIIGYFNREINGNIFVDLGKVEGFLPKKFQSPLDKFGRDGRAGEENRIKALIKEVKKNRHTNIVQLLLSRTCSDFVRRILELEVPEIYNGIIEIKNIVREAGYRTKVIVASTKDGVDPVGSCVGPKGNRIQHVIAELGGEKIDIIEYTDNVKEYIARALSPADVDDVVIIDEEKRSAVAIVNPTQLSLAVGKQGMNVRLANRLVDWNILVKTEEDFKEMDVYNDAIDAAERLFVDNEESDVISAIHELPGITEEIVAALENSGITEIQDVIYMTEEQICAIEGMTDEMVGTLLDIIANTVEIEDEEEEEIVDDNEEEVEQESEELLCPECNEPIEIGMSECPHCGVGLTFEYYEDDK